MFLTASDSTHTVWFSRMRRVVSLCALSRRWSAIRAGSRATFRRAFSRFFEPFCLRARFRCACAKRRSATQVLRISDLLARAEDGQVFQTHIHADERVHHVQRLDVFFHQMETK